MLPHELRYMIYSPGGFNRGVYRTHCSLASDRGDADLASYLTEKGANPGDRWYARLDREESPDTPYLGLFFIDIEETEDICECCGMRGPAIKVVVS